MTQARPFNDNDWNGFGGCVHFDKTGDALIGQPVIREYEEFQVVADREVVQVHAYHEPTDTVTCYQFAGVCSTQAAALFFLNCLPADFDPRNAAGWERIL